MKVVKYDLSVAEERRVNEFLGAIRTPCISRMHNDSPYNSPAFESEFRSRLLAQHFFVGSPLFQESFESAFLASCIEAGFSAAPASDGQRFWDLQVNEKKISLKSSKAKSLREGKLNISKLTEAAWIQDCRTASRRREHTLKLFEDYCSEVDSIIQLRYFSKTSTYELVEIPVRPLFSQIKDTKLDDFSADGPSIKIPPTKDSPDFTLKLDRSDAKVTISNINKAVCLVHGTWQLDLTPAQNG